MLFISQDSNLDQGINDINLEFGFDRDRNSIVPESVEDACNKLDLNDLDIKNDDFILKVPPLDLPSDDLGDHDINSTVKDSYLSDIPPLELNFEPENLQLSNDNKKLDSLKAKDLQDTGSNELKTFSEKSDELIEKSVNVANDIQDDFEQEVPSSSLFPRVSNDNTDDSDEFEVPEKKVCALEKKTEINFHSLESNSSGKSVDGSSTLNQDEDPALLTPRDKLVSDFSRHHIQEFTPPLPKLKETLPNKSDNPPDVVPQPKPIPLEKCQYNSKTKVCIILLLL